MAIGWQPPRDEMQPVGSPYDPHSEDPTQRRLAGAWDEQQSNPLPIWDPNNVSNQYGAIGHDPMSEDPTERAAARSYQADQRGAFAQDFGLDYNGGGGGPAQGLTPQGRGINSAMNWGTTLKGYIDNKHPDFPTLGMSPEELKSVVGQLYKNPDADVKQFLTPDQARVVDTYATFSKQNAGFDGFQKALMAGMFAGFGGLVAGPYSTIGAEAASAPTAAVSAPAASTPGSGYEWLTNSAPSSYPGTVAEIGTGSLTSSAGTTIPGISTMSPEMVGYSLSGAAGGALGANMGGVNPGGLDGALGDVVTPGITPGTYGPGVLEATGGLWEGVKETAGKVADTVEDVYKDLPEPIQDVTKTAGSQLLLGALGTALDGGAPEGYMPPPSFTALPNLPAATPVSARLPATGLRVADMVRDNPFDRRGGALAGRGGKSSALPNGGSAVRRYSVNNQYGGGGQSFIDGVRTL